MLNTLRKIRTPVIFLEFYTERVRLPVSFILLFLLLTSSLTCSASSVQKAPASKSEKKGDYKCPPPWKDCEYESMTAQCQRLSIGFRKSWKKDQPPKFILSFKELIEKEGAVIEWEDGELLSMKVCYNLKAKDLALKKAELKKQPFVSFITYSIKSVPASHD